MPPAGPGTVLAAPTGPAGPIGPISPCDPFNPYGLPTAAAESANPGSTSAYGSRKLSRRAKCSLDTGGADDADQVVRE